MTALGAIVLFCSGGVGGLGWAGGGSREQRKCVYERKRKSIDLKTWFLPIRGLRDSGGSATATFARKHREIPQLCQRSRRPALSFIRLDWRDWFSLHGTVGRGHVSEVFLVCPPTMALLSLVSRARWQQRPRKDKHTAGKWRGNWMAKMQQWRNGGQSRP